MKILFKVLVFLFLFSGNALAQFNKEEQIIVKAMQDQLKNSMDSLKLDNFPRPDFIQYSYKKGETNMLRYSRGALFEEEIAKPTSLIRTDIIIKDDQGITSHNFGSRGFSVFPRMGEGQDVVPFDPNYDEIRRVFWWLSDVQYKNAINDYNNKKRRSEEPSLPENLKKDIALPDFPALPETSYFDPPAANHFDSDYWHNLLAEVSGIYNDYQGLFDILARIETTCSDIYTLNTEGTVMRHAVTNITLNVKVVVENNNKEYFSEDLVFAGLTANDLPSKQEILAQTKEAINLVLEVSNAEAVEKEYLGPVILDAPLIIDHQMFGGFSASRMPAMANNQMSSNNDNLGIRLYSSNISINATPTLKEYKGKKLIGSYNIDGEGVKPKDNLTIVENGILKKLLNDRVPTMVTPESTGNNVFIGIAPLIARLVMPGVLQVTCSDMMSSKDMKAELIKDAKENGLKYAFIVRRLKNGNAYWFYKVDVQDGTEKLVKRCKLNLNANKPLRRIICSSDNTDVFHLNMLGVNNSIISPDAFLLEEVNIGK
ncbi:MAG: metallopeptidase TldD-related protein [Dysgonomonas sp.]